jgi:hypothetical protein
VRGARAIVVCPYGIDAGIDAGTVVAKPWTTSATPGMLRGAFALPKARNQR